MIVLKGPPASQNVLSTHQPMLGLRDGHFPKKIPVRSNGKVQGIMCKACNFTRAQLIKLGYSGETLSHKTTTYWCEECQTPLCITPCFEAYHTISDFRMMTLAQRIQNQ